MKVKNEKMNAKGKRIEKNVITGLAAVMMAFNSSALTIFAEGEAAGESNTGKDPGGFASDMLGYAWWVLIAICGIFAGLSLVKTVQSQSDEDVRGRNNGIATLCISGAAIVILLLVKGKTS